MGASGGIDDHAAIFGTKGIAIDWLRRIRPLHQHLGTAAAFTEYLELLRQTYRAKRNFFALLEKFAMNLGK